MDQSNEDYLRTASKWKAQERGATKSLLRLVRLCEKEYKMKKPFRIDLALFVAVLAVWLLITVFISCAGAEVDDKQAVKAIVGEASGEGYRGMLAVASAIRNRKTLKGVYGLNAKHVKNEPQWVWEKAKKAWLESKVKDVVDGADHWESVHFPEPKWAKNMIPTVKVGNHQFWRSK